MSLPTPPEPWRIDDEDEDHYSLMCMQSYGQQCRNAGLEDAAIDAERSGHLWSGDPAHAFFKLTEAIRSLKS